MFLNTTDLFIRLILSSLIGGVIGYERELKGRDAGIRTHTLVALGATVITMTQLEASDLVIELVQSRPELSNILVSDITRLTAQIVNGIGFLGAGTIIISRRTVSGLTTAASIWAVASLGIAVGMGYYLMAIVSASIIFIILHLIKNLFKVERTKQIEICYKNRTQALSFLHDCFEEYNMKVVSADYCIKSNQVEEKICQDVYTVQLPAQFNMKYFLGYISENEDILSVSTIKSNFDENSERH